MNARQLLSEVKSHFESFDENFALSRLQATHNDILRNIRVRPDETAEMTSMVAGTSEYDTPTGVLRIWEAAWYDSATDHRPLTPRSVDELDDQTKGVWRRADSGDPMYYDERGAKIIFYPAPDTATSAGYPKAVLYVSKTQTLTMATSLPDVPDWDAWLYWTCERYAASKAPQMVQMFHVLRVDATSRLQAYSQGKIARVKPRIQPAVPRINVT